MLRLKLKIINYFFKDISDNPGIKSEFLNALYSAYSIRGKAILEKALLRHLN